MGRWTKYDGENTLLIWLHQDLRLSIPQYRIISEIIKGLPRKILHPWSSLFRSMPVNLKVLGIVLPLWITVSMLYIHHTHDGAFTHDYTGHLEYSRILLTQHRMPAPNEGWETYHPPAFYLINTFLFRNLSTHAHHVRMLCIFYGALALITCHIAMIKLRFISSLSQITILSWIATTPAFMLLFSSYNNDALCILCCMLMLAGSTVYFLRPSFAIGIFLFFVTTLGFMTKYSVIYMALVLAILGGIAVAKRITALLTLRKLLRIFVLSGILLAQWLVHHNYALTQKVFPYNSEGGINERLKIPGSPLRTILMPPGFTDGEWSTPYASFWDKNNKKGSLIATVLSTSVFGEWVYSMGLPDWVIWYIFWTHMLALYWIAHIKTSFPCKPFLYIATLLAIPFLCWFVSYLPFGPAMDFRFIAWTFLPLSILWACTLEEATSWQKIVRHSLFWTSTICQIAFIYHIP